MTADRQSCHRKASVAAMWYHLAIIIALLHLEVFIMTRRKKTRSLSRIHNVKTGNIAKLKRASNSDRQSKKRTNNKTKSVYEKFLDSNESAKRDVIAEQEQLRKQAEKQVEKDTELKQKVESEPPTEKPFKSKTNLLDELDNDLGGDIF